MIITFTGFDGVGKSTNVEELMKSICDNKHLKGISLFDVTGGSEVYNDETFLDEVYEKLSGYDVITSRFYLRTPFLQELQEKVMYTSSEVFSNNYLIERTLLEAYKEAWIMYTRVIEKLDKQNKIIIFDRYFFDEISYRSLYNYPMSNIEKMYLGFRKPDLSFYLCADLELVMKRNRDRDDSRTALFNDEEKMKELYNKLDYITDRFSLKKIFVNNKSIEELKNEVYEIARPYVDKELAI